MLQSCMASITIMRGPRKKMPRVCEVISGLYCSSAYFKNWIMLRFDINIKKILYMCSTCINFLHQPSLCEYPIIEDNLGDLWDSTYVCSRTGLVCPFLFHACNYISTHVYPLGLQGTICWARHSEVFLSTSYLVMCQNYLTCTG